MPSKRAGKGAAVDEDVLAGDVAGLRAAQKRAQRAELVGPAEAAGGNAGHALRQLFSVVAERRAYAIGVEHAGLDRIDCHVVARVFARGAGEKGGEAGARPGGDVEPGD